MKSPRSKITFTILTLSLLASLVSSAVLTTPVYAAGITVTTTLDDTTGGNGCSLREAVINANNDLQTFSDCVAGSGADTITFDDALGTATITLGSALPDLADIDGLTIDGGGDISVSGNDLYRVFTNYTNKSLTLEGITVSNGLAPGTFSQIGGGVYNGGTLIVSNSTFSNNHAGGIGGAILNYGTVTITDSVFTGNTALQAGAIHNGGDTLSTISNSTFTNNSAINSFDGKGGAIYTQEPLTILNSIFAGNTAEIGAAIYDYQGPLTVINSTFSGNSAVNWGGGIFNALDGALTITNSTFSGNSAGLYGGGVYGSPTSITPPITITTTLRNTVLADNTAGIDGTNCYGSITNSGNNIEDDTDCGWGSNDGSMSSTDPLLGLLANNGGPTQTFSLLTGSPAIDGVTFSSPNSAPATDQRGVVRPQGAGYDVGAYELDDIAPTVSSNVRADSNFTAALSVDFTVTFSESVTGVDTVAPFNDFTLTTTGVTGASITSVTPVSGTIYTIGVNTGSGDGTIRLNVVTGGSIVDAAFNPFAVGFFSGQIYTITKSLTLQSVGVNDGWVLESTEVSNVGGTMNSAATVFNLGDDVANKQYIAILHFDTSGLPDTAVITSATLKIKKQLLVGMDPFTALGGLLVDMRRPSFGVVGLSVGDFQTIAGRLSVATFDPTPVSNWYSAVLNSSGRNYINLTGTTQFRPHFTIDDNNDTVADYMKFYSGNHATTSVWPTLIIEYYVP